MSPPTSGWDCAPAWGSRGTDPVRTQPGVPARSPRLREAAGWGRGPPQAHPPVALPAVTTFIWVAVAIIAVALYLSWTAGRLDRLHARIDAARAALDAQLLRRASVAQELATSGVLDPAASIVLYQSAHAARQAEDEQREVAESELSQALRAVFAEPDSVTAVRAAPGGQQAVGELTQAVRRVPMARRFHNDSVRAARALRRHRKVRWFRLAGHAPFPVSFEMDDEPPALLTADGAAAR